MSADATWGVGLVVAPDPTAAEHTVRRLLPQARIDHVTMARLPHLVVRVPLQGVDGWPAIRMSFGRLSATSGWLVLTAGPRVDGDDIEQRRARAQALLLLASRLPTTRRLLDLDELLVYQVLAATEPAARAAVVREVLGPILRLPGSAGTRLLATLDALHWNEGSAKAAGRSLGIHVKTVHNRVRRIEELTGLCLDHPPDRLRLDVALYLLRAAEVGIGACA